MPTCQGQKEANDQKASQDHSQFHRCTLSIPPTQFTPSQFPPTQFPIPSPVNTAIIFHPPNLPLLGSYQVPFHLPPKTNKLPFSYLSFFCTILFSRHSSQGAGPSVSRNLNTAPSHKRAFFNSNSPSFEGEVRQTNFIGSKFLLDPN